MIFLNRETKTILEISDKDKSRIAKFRGYPDKFEEIKKETQKKQDDSKKIKKDDKSQKKQDDSKKIKKDDGNNSENESNSNQLEE